MFITALFTIGRTWKTRGFPGGSDAKEFAHNAEDPGSFLGSRRSPEGRHGNPLQYSCLDSSVQLLSRVRLFATLWTTECQASLSITNSWSLPKLMSIELVMPSNHLILYCPLLLLPSIFPSIRVFSNESALHIR